jgi:hypothetical protein
MSRTQRGGLALLFALAAAACGDAAGGPVEPPPPSPAPVLTGAWRAHTVHGQPVPDVIYRWDPVEMGGRVFSTHFVIDSVFIVISPDGKYQHALFATEWEGEAGGLPHTKKVVYRLYDHGEWERADGVLTFESGYLQNHRMTGTFGADGVLRMRHGLSHGDEPVDFTYARLP